MLVNLHVQTVLIRWTPPIEHSEDSKTNICKNYEIQSLTDREETVTWQPPHLSSISIHKTSTSASARWFSSLKTLMGGKKRHCQMCFCKCRGYSGFLQTATVQGSAAQPGWHVYREGRWKVETQTSISQPMAGFLEILHLSSSESSTTPWSDDGAAW